MQYKENPDGCPFCDLVDDGSSPVWRYLFPDGKTGEILYEAEQFFVVLDTAPIVPGHLLLITKEHHGSMAALPIGAYSELVGLKERAESGVRSGYGAVTAFEHGALTSARHGGACVDHAHLHILPGSFPLLPHVIKDYPETRRFASYLEALEQLRGNAYLLFGNGDAHVYGAAAPACTTQYLRRLVARTAGAHHRWKWRDCVRSAGALYLRDDLADATLKIRI